MHSLTELPDVENECETGEAQCDENAECIDTEEAYECECREGYEGNGLTCRGMISI